MARGAINITTVPADVGSVFRGKAKAPDAILNSTDLVERLGKAGYEVKQKCALPEGSNSWTHSTINDNGVKNEVANIDVCQHVRNSIQQTLQPMDEHKSFQLILGGECCMLPAIMSAFWRNAPLLGNKVGLLYIDGDCDLTVPCEPGSSGNFASMTMTHLTMREGALDSMRQFCRPDGRAVVDSSNIVLFGLNIATPASAKREHLAYLFNEEFRVITSAAVEADPVLRAKQALKWFEDQEIDTILVHLDVDSIDAGQFPLANVPNYTGASFESIMKAVKECLKHDRVAGLVVAEVNPDHDPGLSMTKRLVNELVSAFESR